MDGGDRRDEIVEEMCRASVEWWNTFRCVEWIVNLTNKIRRRRKSSTCMIGIEKDATLEYMIHITKLGQTFLELLSEALGLKPDHPSLMDCGKVCSLVCHYYLACLESELTLGNSQHLDPAFLTLLLTKQIGGLQVLHQNQWIDVEPIEGGLIINVGDFLQIVSNGKFKSVDHRVVSNRVGPRMSITLFS
ncbi:hypothetical protein LOK49_LG08G02748 [Camellia lanceoleosa]|uniref:Uncharacterized protein n=1 Tax=Camellia lanceoleosa TaxID=1840588 RepID=A0ACC0GRI7_9ERIC|nr:hypothetical protein LOK49_LG08G02748 [Camellia lanceoleosa]